ncbi:MAG: hypothetical protein ABIH82_00900 [Candidatus Woesearchaeota archaeon]
MTAQKELVKFQKNIRLMSNEELMDLLGYMAMRTFELEMLFMVLKEKGVVAPEDFHKYTTKLSKGFDKKFGMLTKRKKFSL